MEKDNEEQEEIKLRKYISSTNTNSNIDSFLLFLKLFFYNLKDRYFNDR